MITYPYNVDKFKFKYTNLFESPISNGLDDNFKFFQGFYNIPKFIFANQSMSIVILNKQFDYFG